MYTWSCPVPLPKDLLLLLLFAPYNVGEATNSLNPLSFSFPFCFTPLGCLIERPTPLVLTIERPQRGQFPVLRNVEAGAALAFLLLYQRCHAVDGL